MSLDLSYDPENIFSKIIAGSIPCAKVFEDADVLSFMDAFPQTRGHVLVIPKQVQAVNFLDVDKDTLNTLINKTQDIARAVKAAFSPDGIRIMQFNGTPAGQTVFHLHFHIIPMYEAQDMAGHAHGQQADMSELTELAAQISAAL